MDFQFVVDFLFLLLLPTRVFFPGSATAHRRNLRSVVVVFYFILAAFVKEKVRERNGLIYGQIESSFSC
jgi:hypothetical protein